MATTVFDDDLLDGETILWSGRPGQGLRLTPRDGLLIPFSLLWGGFAIFWEASVLRTHAPSFMALFGVPFVLVGLYLIVGRFFVDAWLRARITYALTDRRVLVSRAGPWPSYRAVALRGLPEASLHPMAGGRGTIRFGAGGTMAWNRFGNTGFGAWTPALDPVMQFIAIAEAQRVYRLIQQHAAGHPT